jgi:SAM-dependent methyltransferase
MIFLAQSLTSMDASPYRFKNDAYSSHAVILDRLGPGRGRTLLDVGAADGFLSEHLTRLGCRVSALERDAAQAERARGRCAEIVVADLDEAAETLSGPFDAIVYGDVLEHLSDPLAALVVLNRALAADGLVIVSVPNVAHLWVRLQLLSGRFEYADRGILDRTHLRFFTRRTFVALLVQAGLAVEELAVTPVPLPLLVPDRLHGAWLHALHAASAAASRGWKSGLAYQFVAVCRPRSAERPLPLASPAGETRHAP